MTKRTGVLWVAMGFLILCICPMAAADEEPVIAVAAEGATADAQVSEVAARCPYFLLFDKKGAVIASFANPHHGRRGGGAGPEVVDWLWEKGVRTLIAGEFGPRMAQAMQRKGMAARVATGTATDVVKQVMP